MIQSRAHRAVWLALVMLLAVLSYGQVPPHIDQVQAMLRGSYSAQQAHLFDLRLLQEPGVLMSRTDVNTHNLLLQVVEGCALTKSSVEAMLAPFDVHVGCWERGPLTSAPFHHLDAKHCDHIEEQK